LIEPAFGGKDGDVTIVACTGGRTAHDAILLSLVHLDAEPGVTLDLVYDDLIQYRTEVLKKPHPALKVMVTTRSLDLRKYDLIKSKGEKLIITTEESMKQTLSSCPADFLEQHNVSFATFLPLINGKLPVVEISSYLKLQKGINFLEVSPGPRLLDQFIQYGLIDETRLTTAGILYGAMSSEGNARPLFGRSVQFGDHDSPLLEYTGIRLHGKHHLFLRGKWIYRHLNK